MLSKGIKFNIQHGEYIERKIEELKERCNLEDQKELLGFVLYYDDLEVVNAIGNQRKKHKLGTFLIQFIFFILNNLNQVLKKVFFIGL